MSITNKVEVLAPAGSMEAFFAAIHTGADAVFMGVDTLNARTMAKNFSIDEYITCLNYAHIRDVKVYLTLNTLCEDDEIQEALKIVEKLYVEGLDAVIVQDLGLAYVLHQMFPKLPLHASTQMSVYSLLQVKFLETLGFTRVVLARELSIEEIKYICQNTSMEIEVFVHGALCVCLSGQCNMSALIGNRSANKGSCAQPCRMKYSLYKDKEKLVQDRYLLSKKDIYGINHVEALINAGVTSLKIEGRNRSPEYVAQAVLVYKKKAQEHVIDSALEKNLQQMFVRTTPSSGYFDGVLKAESISFLSPKNTGLYLGKICDKNNKLIKVKLNEDIFLHDGIEVIETGSSTIVTLIKDEKGNFLNNDGAKKRTIRMAWRYCRCEGWR